MTAEHTAGSFHFLPPVPESVGEARRLLTRALRSSGVDDDLVETARLLVSEVVTNAVLHARTSLGLRLDVRRSVVRVEVSDRSSRIPVARHYTPTAATGRGMALVEALSLESGTQTVDGGKVVWFALARTDHDGATGDLSPGQDVVPGGPAVASFPVAFLRVPVALYDAFVQQAEGLLREYLLAAYSSDPDLAKTARLSIAAGALSWVTDRVNAAIVSEGAAASLDVILSLPAEAGPAFPVLRTVLAEAVEMADAGELLAPPSQPEIVALGEWFCQQVMAQSLGELPRPWENRHDGRPPDRPAPEWSPASLDAAASAMVAADESNRILAVNPALTALLGWTAADLVGNRIVSLVPEDLREAHIAGFTRYLATGVGRILGHPVDVSALHRDGSRVPVTLRVSEQLVPSGGRVFLAELTAAG